MKKFEVSIEANAYVEINAETKEEAKQIAMESEKIGRDLLESAWVSDVELIGDAKNVKGVSDGS